MSARGPASPLHDDINYLKKLFELSPTGVMVADDHARYVDVNQAACELLGRARDAIVGAHLSTIVAPGRQAEVDLQWQAFLRDGSQQGNGSRWKNICCLRMTWW